MRWEALQKLCCAPPSDVLSCETWNSLRTSLSAVLDDRDPDLSVSVLSGELFGLLVVLSVPTRPDPQGEQGFPGSFHMTLPSTVYHVFHIFHVQSINQSIYCLKCSLTIEMVT